MASLLRLTFLFPLLSHPLFFTQKINWESERYGICSFVITVFEELTDSLASLSHLHKFID